LSYLRNNNFDLVEIIDHCKGLLLCYYYNLITFVKSYIICNHLTKEHAVLPSHDRLFTTYCLLIPHILTICNIRLFVFVMSKKKNLSSILSIFSWEMSEEENFDVKLPPYPVQNGFKSGV